MIWIELIRLFGASVARKKQDDLNAQYAKQYSRSTRTGADLWQAYVDFDAIDLDDDSHYEIDSDKLAYWYPHLHLLRIASNQIETATLLSLSVTTHQIGHAMQLAKNGFWIKLYRRIPGLQKSRRLALLLLQIMAACFVVLLLAIYNVLGLQFLSIWALAGLLLFGFPGFLLYLICGLQDIIMRLVGICVEYQANALGLRLLQKQNGLTQDEMKKIKTFLQFYKQQRYYDGFCIL